MNALLLMKTITPLHVGIGRSAGYIDLEIAREKTTGWPVVPGAGVKGALQAAFVADKDDAWEDDTCDPKRVSEAQTLFGKTSENPNAGQLCFSDFRTLLFPVPSICGGFAYATSPLALRRFAEAVEVARGQFDGFGDLTDDLEEIGTAKVVSNSPLMHANKVYLEDLDLNATPVEDPTTLWEYVPESILSSNSRRQLAVVSDTIFRFLCENCTEVTTRVSLEYGSKTAKKGQLRTEEAVPPEAVFYGLVHAQRIRNQLPEVAIASLEAILDNAHFQFGGKSTTGHGLCKVVKL
ncbi:MAG: type III-B CRISPR module RAMP protein Cmr4 [Fimbriimonadaceae bacterium]|nr:MAG: type III-B CRISPR module RAMP protein Cmr4 [Fimbriimonadaceae bacterium]